MIPQYFCISRKSCCYITPPALELQDLPSCNLSYPLPLDYPLLKQNEKLVEHLITKHGVYVDINKVEVILRVGTGGERVRVGVESKAGEGGWG